MNKRIFTFNFNHRSKISKVKNITLALHSLQSAERKFSMRFILEDGDDGNDIMQARQDVIIYNTQVL